MAQLVYVQSLTPAGAKPVAANIRLDSSSAVVQHIIISDPSSEILTKVHSYAGGNPLAVALTDAAGLHISVQTVAAQQLGAPWTITGSVQATQAGAPWTVVASVSGEPLAVTASVTGQLTVTASAVGQITVTASIAGIPSVVGSVSASQTGDWTVLALSGDTLPVSVVSGTISTAQSVYTSQVGSWNVLQGDDSPWSFVGSVGASQAGAPWTVVASLPGQQTVTSSLIGYATVIASVAGQLSTTASISGVPGVVGSVQATQAGAPWTVVASVPGQQTVTASLIGYPTVIASVAGQLTTTASISGVPGFVGSVGASQLGAPWTVVASAPGQQTVTASLIGYPTVIASVAGQLTATASISGVPGVVGSVGASQLGAPWTVVASAPGQQTVTASLIGYPTVIASVAGQLTATTSISGIPAVTGSVEATQAGAPWSFTGSAEASQAGSWSVLQGEDAPWSFTGSVRATQSGSWDVQIGRVFRTKLATLADTVTRAGSYFLVLSAMEYASAVRVMFSTRDAGSLSQACSVNFAVSQAVTSGTWVYEQAAAAYSGTLYQYNAVGEYIRFSFSNPVSHAYVQGAIYASPIT